MKLGNWASLVFMAVAILSVGTLGFDAWRTHTREMDEASREALSLVKLLEDDTRRSIQAVEQALDALAANPDAVLLPRADGQDISASFKRRLINLPQLLWFSAWDPQGNLIASSAPEASTLGNAAGDEWHTRYSNPAELDPTANRNNLGSLRKSKTSSQWFLPITRALRAPDGKLRAVVMAAVDPQYFSDLYNQVNVRQHGNVTLFEANGTIIARSPANDDFVGRSAASGDLFRIHLPQSNNGIVQLKTTLENRSILLAYRTVADYPLVINVAFDERDILGKWNESLGIYIGLAIALVGISILGAYFFAKSVESAKILAVSQKEAEAALERQRAVGIVQQRLINAERIANVGNWHWNIITNELFWSDQIYRIFGLLPQEFGASYPAFLNRVYPEDRATVEEAVRRAVEGGMPYDIDHRIVRADGIVRIVHEQGEITRDETGRAIEMNGVVQDVTELREAEAKRIKSELRLAAILSIAPEAIIAVDVAGHIQLFNDGAEQIFGYKADTMIGRPLEVLLPERARTHHLRMMQAFGEGAEPSRIMSRRGRIAGLRHDGTEFPAEASIAKIEVAGEKLFTVILRDITERVEQERVLVAAKDAAESANRAKSEFLANMSHELRTPLNAVIGFSELITQQKLGPIGNERYCEYAADITSSGKHLLDVINDILDMAKIEARQTSLDESTIDLGQVALASAGFMSTAANDKNIVVTTQICPMMPPIRADERRIKQIVLNLLSNAIKFSPKGSEVTMRISIAENGEPTLVVSDTGIGIPLELLPHVGQPFIQVDGALTRRFEGTGLGLALSKAFADLHGGTLTIESEIGRGTTVTLRLPADRVVDEANISHIA